MSEKISELSVDIIDAPFKPIRSEITTDSISDLAADIKKHGLIQPITLRPKGERYEVVAGHRRFRATKLAGLPTIRAVVMDITEEEADGIKVRENLYRVDINPIDEAKHIHYLIERYKYEPHQLSKLLGKGEQYLMARYDLLEYPDYLKTALENEQIGLGAAQWLQKITDDRVKRDYVRFAIMGGITSKKAQGWYTSWYAGNLPRDPSQFKEPEKTVLSEPAPLLEPCVLCRTNDDINKMQMYYGHTDCAAVAAAAAKTASAGQTEERGAPDQPEEHTNVHGVNKHLPSGAGGGGESGTEA